MCIRDRLESIHFTRSRPCSGQHFRYLTQTQMQPFIFYTYFGFGLAPSSRHSPMNDPCPRASGALPTSTYAGGKVVVLLSFSFSSLFCFLLVLVLELGNRAGIVWQLCRRMPSPDPRRHRACPMNGSTTLGTFCSWSAVAFPTINFDKPQAQSP